MDAEVLAKYRKAGKIAGKVREFGLGLIREGVTLLSVAEAVERQTLELGGNIGFPVNIAIDDQAAHYSPCAGDELTFKRGMVVKLDVGCHVDGYIGDTASTVEVGTHENRMLIQASREALMNALDIIRSGVDIQLISSTIEDTIKSFGYRPISNLTGHGLGQYELHTGMAIPNVRGPERGYLHAGEIIAIEPFATDGKGWVKETKPSNIYRFLRYKKVKDVHARELLDQISERWDKLPFTERWCSGLTENPRPLLTRLVRSRAIASYPILCEKGTGTVSQAEHTVMITEDGCEIPNPSERTKRTYLWRIILFVQAINSERSCSTTVFGPRPNFSTRTSRTLGDTKAGSVGPRRMFLTPRESSARSTSTAFCSYQAML